MVSYDNNVETEETADKKIPDNQLTVSTIVSISEEISEKKDLDVESGGRKYNKSQFCYTFLFFSL